MLVLTRFGIVLPTFLAGVLGGHTIYLPVWTRLKTDREMHAWLYCFPHCVRVGDVEVKWHPLWASTVSTCNRLTVTYMTYYINNAMRQLLYIEKDKRDNGDRKMTLGKTNDNMCFNLFGFLDTWKALRLWIVWVLL
jgi:hypothetical protein